MQVDRQTVVILVIGVVGISALVFSAATLTDPATEDASGGWLNPDPSEDSEGQIFTDTAELPIPSVYLNALWDALWVGSILFLLLSVWLIDSDKLARGALVILISIVVMSVFGGIFGDMLPASSEILIPENPALQNGSDSLPPSSTGESASPDGGGFSPYLFGAGALAVSVAVGIMYFRSGDDEALEVPEEDQADGDEEQLASLGEAAGRAADGIAASDVAASNAVYEAWVEMTEALDVADPATTTPGEFEAAAVEAGMEAEHVRELTRLFEDIRYGDASVSSERVERAQAALRRIEATYAGDES